MILIFLTHYFTLAPQEALREIILLMACVISGDAVRWIFFKEREEKKNWERKRYDEWVGIWGSVCLGDTDV